VNDLHRIVKKELARMPPAEWDIAEEAKTANLRLQWAFDDDTARREALWFRAALDEARAQMAAREGAR
jgi:hypothetical protein